MQLNNDFLAAEKDLNAFIRSQKNNLIKDRAELERKLPTPRGSSTTITRPSEPARKVSCTPSTPWT